MFHYLDCITALKLDKRTEEASDPK